MDSKETYFDRIMHKLKNYKVVAILIVLGISIGALAQFTNSLKSIISTFYKQEEQKVIWGIELPAYVLTDSAYETQEEAGRQLAQLNDKGLRDPYFEENFKTKTGFFYIPDFPFLTNKQLYQVYIGPYQDKETAMAALCDYNRKYNRDSYGLLLSIKPGRDHFRCSE